MKNAGLKNHQLSNRRRRIPKRILAIQGEITMEKRRAIENNREPNTAEMYQQLNRLQGRAHEIAVIH